MENKPNTIKQILKENDFDLKKLKKAIEKIDKAREGYAYISDYRLRIQKTNDFSSYKVFEVCSFDGFIDFFYGEKGYEKLSHKGFVKKLDEIISADF